MQPWNDENLLVDVQPQIDVGGSFTKVISSAGRKTKIRAMVARSLAPSEKFCFFQSWAAWKQNGTHTETK